MKRVDPWTALFLIILVVVNFSLYFLITTVSAFKSAEKSYLNPLDLELRDLEYTKDSVFQFSIYNPNNKSVRVAITYAYIKTDFGSYCMITDRDPAGRVLYFKPFESKRFRLDLKSIPECTKLYIQLKAGVRAKLIISYEEIVQSDEEIPKSGRIWKEIQITPKS